jgi:glucose/arabinose dehydrogenase/mono/diheme cytochrome c family protein
MRANKNLGLLFVMLAVFTVFSCATPKASESKTLLPVQKKKDKKKKKSTDNLENWKSIETPAAPSLTPAEAMKKFKIAPGFKLELVASEPVLDNPVAMTWDGDGRLWVVQMPAYMHDAYGKDEEKMKTGRITVLQDTNGDGKMNKHTVFLDGLIMPRTIAMVKGGVLIAEPPHLWFCEDTNGDLKCDKKTKVANYAKQGPVEHTENALMPALDNWMYSAKSKKRHRFVDGKIIEEDTKFRGQWGITQDNYGRLYYTTNSNYLHYDWETYGQKMRALLSDKSINAIRVNPGINRGYQKHMLLTDYRLARVTAISGPAAYRGDVYDKSFINGMFIPEPAANAIAYFEYKEENPASILFEHKLYDDPKWKKREFLTSTDERFRPITMYGGPDGCMYFIDLYHGILQHRVYVTDFYLRKQILHRGLDKGNQKGRIYRIVPEGAKINHKSPKLLSKKPAQLVPFLAHKNGWYRDTAQRLIVQSGDTSLAPQIEQLIRKGKQLTKIHGLWTLKGLGSLSAEMMTWAKGDLDSKIKLTAEALAKDTTTVVKAVISNVKNLSKKNQKIYALGKEQYNLSCFACHQPQGQGLAKLAPPLAGSEWVTKKKDEILIRIALHGITGPIKVKGKVYQALPVMPGHAASMDDKKIAAVLTFVRNTWGNKGKAISQSAVKKLRKKYAKQKVAWTAKELEK